MASNPNVKFIRVKGRVVPIMPKEGRLSKARRKAQRKMKGKFQDPGPNQQPRPYKSRNAARKFGRGFKRGGKLAIGYGGLTLAGYGAKKAWDNSEAQGKGALIGAGVGSGVAAGHYASIAKDPKKRKAFNIAMARTKGAKTALALGAAAAIGSYSALGATFGKAIDQSKGRK